MIDMKRSTAISIILLGFFLSTVSLLVSSDGVTSTVNEIPAKNTVIAGTATVEELLAEGNRHQDLGQIEQAIEKYKAALALAQEGQDTYKIAFSLCLSGEQDTVGEYFDPPSIKM